MNWFGKALLGLSFTLACAGCDNAHSGSPQTPSTPQAAITLKPLRDPWPTARQRWWDIADQPYSSAFRRSFAYSGARVTLSFERAPATKYFRGHLSARNLKPNFAYQMKLVGKPVSGSRGWKDRGDDLSNERLGRAARWWDDTAFRNADDKWYDAFYLNTPPTRRRTIYGYQFIGNFVTDENGGAEVPVEGRYAYHITWQDWQYGAKEVVAGTYHVGSSTPPFYAYGERRDPKLVKLWYEWEPKRAREIRLTPGTYQCRFVLTEETFHNQLGGTNNPLGGYWATVMGTEDIGDTRIENDVIFTIH